MSRKKARDTAFKCIYQLGFDYDLNIDELLFNNFNEDENSDEEKEYIEKVIKGINKNLDDIDEKILTNLKGWTIDRIAKIDLAILRLAVYEIMYIEDMPDKVSANEAVELAKSYGDDKSSNFVNGIIAKIIENKQK